MALGDNDIKRFKLEYTKDWKNPEDFPTYQPREEEVRADMQRLFDEMRDAFNNFLEGVAASYIPFTKTSEIDETDVQAAIENVQSQVKEASTGAIIDRSIDGVKLVLGAVGNDELAGDISPEKLAGGITNEQLAGEITADKLAGSIPESKLALAKPLSDKADLEGSRLSRRQRAWRPPAAPIAGSLTLAPSHAESVVYTNNSSAITITIPMSNPELDFEIGASILIVRGGTGNVTIAPASGVELLSAINTASGNVLLDKKYSVVLLTKTAANRWFAGVMGNQAGKIVASDITFGNGTIPGAALRDGEVAAAKLAGGITNAQLAGSIAASKLAGSIPYSKTDGTIQKKHAVVKHNGDNYITLTRAGWSSNTQTVTVTGGVTSSNEVIVTPWVANSTSGTNNWTRIQNYNVRCVAQGSNTLTFRCAAVPDDTVWFSAIVLD